MEGTTLEQQRIQERLGDVTAQANAIQAKIRETGMTELLHHHVVHLGFQNLSYAFKILFYSNCVCLFVNIDMHFFVAATS